MLTDSVGAVSVGIVDGKPVLDLDYVEDSSAEVDVNVVMAGDGRLIEVQATAERAPLDRGQLDELLDLAASGIEEIGLAQQDAVETRCVPELHFAEVLLRVVLAAVLGGAIGVEREIREREAGLRTHLLVAVGAALFTLVSAYGWHDFHSRTRAASRTTRRGLRPRS